MGDSLNVATTGPVQPPLSIVTPNAAERFVYTRAYETLVSVDCGGQVIAGLATRWTQHDARSATVVLRGGAQFWNGDRVTANSVIAALKTSNDSLARLLADSAVIGDDSTLLIRTASLDLRTLASSRMIVGRPLAGSPWPEGTGTHRVIPGESLRLNPTSAGGAASYHIRSATPAEARNFIDDGIDLLITGDSVTAAYAARRMSAPPIALDWDRTWVFIPPATFSDVADSSRFARLQEDLASGAVRSNVRAASAPTWTIGPAICFARRLPPVRSRIAYESIDPTARALAERLVAVASLPPTDPTSVRLFDGAQGVQALPLGRDTYAAALRTASELGLIASIPFRSQRGCRDGRVIPLVDTRWQAVVRMGVRRTP